jgi:hypothetical protein
MTQVPDAAILVGTFIPLVGVALGGLLLLVPVVGLTVRFAARPLLETLERIHALRDRSEDAQLLERRVRLLEQHVAQLTLLGIASTSRAPQLESGAGIEWTAEPQA